VLTGPPSILVERCGERACRREMCSLDGQRSLGGAMRPRTNTILFAKVEDDVAASPQGSPRSTSSFRSSEPSSSSSESSETSEAEDSKELGLEGAPDGGQRRGSSKRRSSNSGMGKFQLKQMSTTRVASILKGFNFFQNYEAKVIAKLAQLVTQATHPEGTVIFRQGDPPGNCYALVSGQVGVFVNMPSGGDADDEEVAPGSPAAREEARKSRRASFVGSQATMTRRTSATITAEMAAILQASKPTVEGFSTYYPDLDLGTKVATLQAGSLVGELALLHDQKRSASLKCLQDTKMIIIHRREFENVLRGEMQRVQQEKEIFLLGHLPGLRHLAPAPKGRVRPHPSYYFQKTTVAKGHEFLKQGQMAEPQLHIVFNGTVERRRCEVKLGYADPVAEASRLAIMKASTPSRPRLSALRGLPSRPQSATSLGHSGTKQSFDVMSSKSKVVRRVGTLQVGAVFGSLSVVANLGEEPFTVVATSSVEVYSIGSEFARLPRKLIDTIQEQLLKSMHLQLKQLHSSRFAAEAPGLFQKPRPPKQGLGPLYWQVTPMLPGKDKDEDKRPRRPQSAIRSSSQPVRRVASPGKRPHTAPTARTLHH